jgi:Ser/Thr protein kinase RdoA (MazF antagonist)
MTGARDVLDHPDVARALRAAFGAKTPEHVEALGGGMSRASVAKVTVDGRAYVVKRVAEDARAKAGHELACLAIASERGVAPPLVFADATSGVSVRAHAAGMTLVQLLMSGGDRGKAFAELGLLLRRLHDGPAFPGDKNVDDVSRAVASRLASRGCAVPGQDELVDHIARITRALEPHGARAPCHHDVNPGNVVFEGGRAWLIDWDAASQGDPLHDLAAPWVFLRHVPEADLPMLAAYFGRAPTPVEAARVHLARTRTQLLIALVFAEVASLRPAAAPVSRAGPPSPLEDPAAYGESKRLSALADLASSTYARALATLG